MLTVNQSVVLADNVEKAIYGLVKDPEILTPLAEQVVDLEKTFIAKGIETDETEVDKVEDIIGYMISESRNFRRWLEEKVIEYFDWERLRGKRVNRTQRAIKRKLREMENGRSSFKKICLDGAKAFGYSDENSANLKDMQRQLKETRSKTRDFMSQIRTKEVLEV